MKPNPDIVVQMYDTYIQTITASEQRRQQTTTIYLTLIAAAFASIGALSAMDPVYPAVISLVVALLWRQKILFFRDLATEKWKIALSLEEQLPMQPFKDEYALLVESRKNKRFGTIRLSDIEARVPLVIIVVTLGYLLIRAIQFVPGLETGTGGGP